MYDEDLMETRKVTNGLFCGPLFVTVSTLPLQSSLVTPEGSHRFTSLFLSQSVPQGGRIRQLEGVLLN